MVCRRPSDAMMNPNHSGASRRPYSRGAVPRNRSRMPFSPHPHHSNRNHGGHNQSWYNKDMENSFNYGDNNSASSPKESFTYSSKSPPVQLHSPPITGRPPTAAAAILMPYGAADDGSINNRSQQILRAGPSHIDRHRINMGNGMQDRNRHTMSASSIDRHSNHFDGPSNSARGSELHGDSRASVLSLDSMRNSRDNGNRDRFSPQYHPGNGNNGGGAGGGNGNGLSGGSSQTPSPPFCRG